MSFLQERFMSFLRRKRIDKFVRLFSRNESGEDFETFSAKASNLPSSTLIFNQSRLGRSIKRTIDVLFSIFLLILGSPLLILIAIIIKLSSKGPILYVQKRIGRDYKPFGCIKFRTMQVDADNILTNVLDCSPSMRAEFEKDFKLRKDPRITLFGKFLRRSSLDELPQFLNVLRGEMSVVGPRPIVKSEVERYGEFMDEVLSVRPGLTGLWQVSGRNNLSYEKRVSMDFYYARNRSFALDLVIIIKTFGVLLLPMDRGAY